MPEINGDLKNIHVIRIATNRASIILLSYYANVHKLPVLNRF